MHRSLKLLGLTSSLSILFTCSIVVGAQTPAAKSLPSPDPKTAEKGTVPSDEDSPLLGPMEEEMRAKRAIKYAEKEYHENLDRAREAAQLGAQIEDSFKQHKALGRGDDKKLERMEKLAKRIRSEAGGSNDEVALEDPPHELASTLTRLAEISESLRKVVEKTPRQVMSAAVIAEANVTLQLIRFARHLSR